MHTSKNPVVYSELVDLIAGSNPQRILAFRFSAKAAQQVERLVDREKSGKITLAEKDELDMYMLLSRIVMQAQTEAYKMLHGTHSPKNS